MSPLDDGGDGEGGDGEGGDGPPDGLLAKALVNLS